MSVSSHACVPLFSYGTLQLPEVQRATYGRLLEGRADILCGYRLAPLTITDPGVVALSGEISCSGPGCDDVTEAGSLNLQVGTMLRPRLRAVLDLWGMAHKEEDFAVNQTLLTAGLQIWVINRLWLRGGVGIATAGFNYDGDLADTDDERHSTVGLAGGIGFEILSRRSFALDLELRGGTGFYDDKRAHNGAFNIGVTWY